MAYELIYTSIASESTDRETIGEILEKSIENNREAGICGLLVYMPSTREFAQVLEGERADILRLYHIIQRDSRHHSVQLVYHGPTEKVVFEDWDMMMETLDLMSSSRIISLRSYLQDPATSKSRMKELAAKGLEFKSLKVHSQ